MTPELFSSAWHVISSFLVFAFGLLSAPWFGKKFQTKSKRTLLLYLWHTIFCLVYIVYVRNNGGDAIGYYYRAAEGMSEFEFGTAAVDLFTYVLVSLAGLSFLGAFLFYNILGFIGLLAFDASLRVATLQNTVRVKKLASLIVFLPSISFWTSAIGKDSVAFMAVGLALWAATALQRHLLMMVFAIIAMLLVRPHMAGIMVLSLAAATAMSPAISLKFRLLIGSIAVAGSAALVPIAISYVGLENSATAVGVSDYVAGRQGYNMEGGGGVDIASMSVPEQLFTYVFRPILLEARNITSLAASLDNTLLLVLAVLAARGYLRRRRQHLVGQRIFMWFYVVVSWVLLATTTANLGIAVRQKWMFVPFLIFLLLPLIGKSHKLGGAPSASVRNPGGAN